MSDAKKLKCPVDGQEVLVGPITRCDCGWTTEMSPAHVAKLKKDREADLPKVVVPDVVAAEPRPYVPR